jgi:hypothetical protein
MAGSTSADDAEPSTARIERAFETLARHGSLTAAELARLGACCTALHRTVDQEGSSSALVLSGPVEPVAFFEGALAAGHAPPRLLAGLERLGVQFCDELKDAHLSALPPSLTELKLDACHGLTDAGVETLSRVCGASLTSLSIYWNNHLTDRAALHLSLRCGRLRHLSLSGCKGIGSTGILSLASRMRKLEHLDLTRLPLVDDVAVTAIAQASRQLASLRLYADSQLGDPPILAVAKASGGALTLLDCTGLNALTDAAVCALAEHCPRLRHLVLSWVLRLTNSSIAAVAERCPLELLSLHGLRGVTTAALDALAQHRADTLTALDVRGCTAMGSPTPTELRARLPRLDTFIIHT